MDDLNLHAFTENFSRPGWLLATFVLPFCLVGSNKFIKQYLHSKWRLLKVPEITKGEHIEEFTPQRSEKPPDQKLLNYATSCFLTIIKYARPVFIGMLVMYIILLGALFALTRTSPQPGVLVYGIYFMIALGYNNRERRKEANKPVPKMNRTMQIIRILFLSVTYAQVVGFLIILVNQSFFSLLAFSSLDHKIDRFFLSSFLLLFPVMGLLVVKDLIYPVSTPLTRILAFVLCCCVGSFLILFINLMYMVN